MAFKKMPGAHALMLHDLLTQAGGLGFVRVLHFTSGEKNEPPPV